MRATATTSHYNILWKPGYSILCRCGQMTVKWEFLVISTNRTRIHLPNPNISLYCCSAVSLQCACTKMHTAAMQGFFLPQKADSQTWWPIKSKVQQPLLSFMVTFDINHQCPGQGCDSGRRIPLNTLSHSHSQPGLYINTPLGGHLLDIKPLQPEVKNKSSSSNAAGGLYNNTPQSVSIKRTNAASGPFFFPYERKLC